MRVGRSCVGAKGGHRWETSGLGGWGFPQGGVENSLIGQRGCWVPARVVSGFYSFRDWLQKCVRLLFIL